MTLQLSFKQVVVCNIPNYIVDCISVGGSVMLTPHEFVEIAWNLVRMAPFHPFQLCFNMIPQYFVYVPQLLDRQSYANG